MSEVGLGPVWGPEVPLQSELARGSPVTVQGQRAGGLRGH